MTKEQRDEELHRIIQAAVAAAGGNWKRCFGDQLEAIKSVYREYLLDEPRPDKFAHQIADADR